MNEYCRNCKSKDVCKIYDFLGANSNVVDLAINSCSIFEDKYADTPIIENTIELKEPPKMTFKDYKNFNTAKKTNNTIDFASIEELFCNECKCKLERLQDIVRCKKCNAIVCSECAYIVPSENKEPEYLCNTCWEEN